MAAAGDLCHAAHGADTDIRDGLCYQTGTVPRRFQQGRQGYHTRRNG